MEYSVPRGFNLNTLYEAGAAEVWFCSINDIFHLWLYSLFIKVSSASARVLQRGWSVNENKDPCLQVADWINKFMTYINEK